MKSIRIKVALVILTVSFAAGFILQIFNSVYYLRSTKELGDVMVLTLILVAILSIAVISIISLRMGALVRALRKVEAGEQVSQDERRRARQVLGTLPRLILIFLVAGFLTGSILAVIIRVTSGAEPFDWLNTITIVLLSSSIGFMGGLQGVIWIDFLLIGPRQALGLTTMDSNGRDWTMRTRIVLATVGAVIFSGILMSMAALGFYRELAVWASGAQPDALTSATFKDAAVVNSRVYQAGIEMAVLIVIIAAWAFSLINTVVRSLTKQLTGLSKRMDEIASGSGDLTSRAHIVNDDEIGALTSSINSVMHNLQNVVQKVKTTSTTVVGSAHALGQYTSEAQHAVNDVDQSLQGVMVAVDQQSSTVQQTGQIIEGLHHSISTVAEKVATQADYVEDSSSSITEIAANINTVSQVTVKASELADGLTKRSAEGGQAMQNMIVSIRDIEQAAKTVSTIVGVISSISAQTNLLAMNAAIEAAHAGDAGAGFAVVADEVRKLAETSAKNAREIISQIKNMDGKIVSGVRLAEATVQSFSEMSTDIGETAGLIQSISQAMNEQKTGAESILKSVASLIDATSQIRELTTEQHKHSNEMSRAMAEIVSASRAIEQAVDVQSKGTRTLSELIAKVAEESVSNTTRAGELDAVVGGFRV